MRRTSLFAALAFALAACSQSETDAPAAGAAGEAASGPAAPEPTPGAPSAGDMRDGPRPGLWRMTVTTMGQTMPAMESCLGETSFEQMQQSQQQAGADCTVEPFRREGGAMVSKSSCAIDGMTMASDIRITGDFDSAYTTEVTTTMTPAPMPGMETTSISIAAQRLGDC